MSVVSSIIFHFPWFCPFLAAFSAALSSLRTTLLSLLSGHRDIFLPSFFHSIALLSTALPFSSLSPSLCSLSLLFYSLLFIWLCLTVVFHLQHPLCLIYLLSPFAPIAQYTLSSFPFLVTVYSVFLVLLPYLHFSLLLTLFLPRSPTLCLFLSSFFLILCRSILVSFTSSFFIYIPFLFFFVILSFSHRHSLSLRLPSFHYLFSFLKHFLPLFSTFSPLTHSLSLSLFASLYSLPSTVHS